LHGVRNCLIFFRLSNTIIWTNFLHSSWASNKRILLSVNFVTSCKEDDITRLVTKILKHVLGPTWDEVSGLPKNESLLISGIWSPISALCNYYILLNLIAKIDCLHKVFILLSNENSLMKVIEYSLLKMWILILTPLFCFIYPNYLHVRW